MSHLEELQYITPELIIAAGIIIAVVLEMFNKKSEEILPWFSVIILLCTGLYTVLNINSKVYVFNGMFTAGGISAIFNSIFNFGAVLVILSSKDYIKKYGSYFGEYYILILSSVLGMMLMAGARDLFVIFLGLELMSICFYVLTGINRKKISGNEASLKYFLLGAFATGFIVYGIALIYGSANTTGTDFILANFRNLSTNVLFIVGMLLFIIGFSFKIAAFPFHMWVPDVYQGSATTISGLMSTGGKAAAFSSLIIILSAFLSGTIANPFQKYFAVIATLSMVYGSIVAISQTNLKRMLAYSSIAHAGYMSIGLASGNYASTAGIIFYLAAYTFMNLGAFGVISIVEGQNDTNLELKYYSGLANKHPFLAALMSLFMFALAGLPPFAGFFGKYYVFVAAIGNNLTWLAIIGVLSSAISVYFYIRVIVYMYFKEPEIEFEIINSKTGMISILLAGILVILIGIFPGSILDKIASSIINF
jgi:NADH-quinone oxidoreductase subunit N